MRDFDPGIGLPRYGRQACGGLAHLAGGIAEPLQRLPHGAFELGDIGIDRALARRGAGVAFALLRLSILSLSSACFLKVSSAPIRKVAGNVQYFEWFRGMEPASWFGVRMRHK